MTTERYQGRLELTWTNKNQRLLSREDGSYEWVSPYDYRVAEVRLLHSVLAVGAVHSERERARDNLLIRGDALNALITLTELPEFTREYVSKVKLAYLDPPFNTQQSFLQYDDALEHSVWLTMMRDRLLSIKELLASNGSVWVHLDDSEVAYCRILMDELFGRDNFVATVVWEKTDSPRMDAALFSARHDYILVYRKSDEFRLNRLPSTDLGPQYTKVDDAGTRYYLNPLRARGRAARRADRPSMYYPMIAPDGTEILPRLPDGTPGRWRWGRERYEADKEAVQWVTGREGWTAWYRVLESENRMRPPETIWTHEEVGSTRTSAYEITRLLGGKAFSTPKPEALIARIITVASDEGDVVLDCFVGSGTTAAVAHKMRRRWIAVEREPETIETFTIPRLTKVIDGDDSGGVTEAAGWSGGGGFRILDVAPSMFAAEQTHGRIFLSEWATNGQLAEATAAQLHYDYEYDPPFSGRRGRSRLAVVDGLVNADVVRLLVGALDEGERLIVCGTAVDPAARDILTELRSGSSVRKIPQSILREYRQTAARANTDTPPMPPAPGAAESATSMPAWP